MKLAEAMALIERATQPPRYRVHFEVRSGGMLRTDYFPDRDEPGIEGIVKTAKLADRFAEATGPNTVNVFVVDADYVPIGGTILKRYPPADTGP
jgi:hypothetical protein